MLWKIYTVFFLVINAISVGAFDYKNFDVVGFTSLVLSIGLNIAVYSYAFGKRIFPKGILEWLFKLNVAMFGVFLAFEILTFIQELIGFDLLRLPTSGVISIIAGFPSLPALYATYKMAYQKDSKAKKKSKKKA